MSDDFYIGWEPKAPRDTGRFVWRVVLLLAGGVLTIVGLIAARQGSFAPALFEFGYDTTLTGTLLATPVPRLRTPGGGDILLVGEGKHGAHAVVAQLDGALARVTGSPIHRGQYRGLEVHQVVVAEDGDRVPPVSPASLGMVTLRGQIVDGKCWLGVMVPGEGKVHRGCAARCISGGAPALFVTEDSTTLLLVVPTVPALLPFVAEPIEITGELLREGDWLILRTTPAAFRRL